MTTLTPDTRHRRRHATLPLPAPPTATLLAVVLAVMAGLFPHQATATGRVRYIKPEIGVSMSYLEAAQGSASVPTLDLSFGPEWPRAYTSPGFLLRIQRLFTPTEDMRYHFVALATLNLGSPLASRHIRMGAGPYAAQMQSGVFITENVGIQTELTLGLRDIADVFVLLTAGGRDDAREQSVGFGVRLSGSLFRLVSYTVHTRWR